MRRCVAAALVLLLAGTSCVRGEPSFAREDLPGLVLSEAEAPAGTVFVGGDSGFLTLDRYAEDPAEEAVLRAAGFETAYIAFFLSPELLRDPEAAGQSLAVSFAVLFADAEGAARGLTAIRDDIRADGDRVQDRPTTGLPEESFGLFGYLEPSLPPGFAFAWRRGNAVFGIVAAGPEAKIDEGAVLELARRMRNRSG